METRVLTVISYGEEEGETYRVTIQPLNIKMVTSPEKMVVRQGMGLYKATVDFVDEDGEDGGGATLYVNRADLKNLEEAAGFYMFGDD